MKPDTIVKLLFIMKQEAEDANDLSASLIRISEYLQDHGKDLSCVYKSAGELEAIAEFQKKKSDMLHCLIGKNAKIIMEKVKEATDE